MKNAGSADFERIGDIDEVPPATGEGEQVAIESLIGQEIAIIGFTLTEARSEALRGRTIATVQLLRRDGTKAWCTTWSGPLISRLKTLEERKALPRRCVIRRTVGKRGFGYYTLESARVAEKVPGNAARDTGPAKSEPQGPKVPESRQDLKK